MSLGFQGSKTDTSLFYKPSSCFPFFVLIYVDDMLILCPKQLEIYSLISTLNQKISHRDLGPASYFLGIEFQPHEHGYLLSQSKYIASILKRLNMDNCKPLPTPCASSSSLLVTDNSTAENLSLYQSLVGALQYVTLTRLDISFVVNKACQKMHQPSSQDWTDLKHLLRYLKGTILHGLLLSRRSNNFICACSDSNWAGSTIDRRSTDGYLVYLGTNLISWC